jgi:hypothetical protein
MKTDKFVKMMLVVIASLVLLNCFKDNGDGISVPFIETKVKASVPPFIQVGKTYSCSSLEPRLAPGRSEFTVNNIDKDSGWINTDGYFDSSGYKVNGWLNSANLFSCVESSPKSK